ncbi:MAG: Gfo/Idh/MocA family oxidoreductase [Verrucomicrobiae bacterium]|nr:Gfo/Idh/MocA family oxidoreductase [Verrucomicrobiae bacterium]
MKAHQLVSRRRFIRATAGTVAAFAIVPRHVLGAPRFVPPSEKLNIAIIGTGGQGRTNARHLFQFEDVQIVAIADPAESFGLERFYYKGVAGRLPVKAEIEKHYAAKTPNYRCADYVDFRHMLEKEKAIDAVLIATPDHLHALPTVLAMRAGKHVYCEKPLTHNIWEARHVAKVAAETGVATQLGSQGHSSVGTRETVKALGDGVIGQVREIHVWVGVKRWNPTLTRRPAEAMPVPPGLNWDLWIGPRSERPFHTAYFPVSWRDFWDFGTTGIGDFGCHDMNTAVRAFDLPLPTRVEAHAAGAMDHEIAPHGSIIYYTFPPAEGRPTIRMTWYDGGLKPPHHEALGKFRLPGRACLFVGEKGVILCDGGGGPPRIFPESLRAEYRKGGEAKDKHSADHHRNWIDACKGSGSTVSPFSYGAHLTEIVLLGVLSLRLQKPIEWDAAEMKAVGLPEAEMFIRESCRKGWEIA